MAPVVSAAATLGRTTFSSWPPIPGAQLSLRRAPGPTYRPQTNGKAERFIQSALREWAYGHPYADSDRRRDASRAWSHFYNGHRPHQGISLKPPVSRSWYSKEPVATDS
jgi:transposase InsO family protein